MSLMFLAVHRFDQGASYRGALLATDNNTTPLEFRCTNAIKPTQLQKTLYGDILDEHILVELIAKPLFDAATQKPCIVIITDALLLNFRKKVSIPVVLLEKESEFNIPEEDQTRRVISSETGKYEPIVMTVHENYLDDRKIAAELLSDTFSKRSLLEPFERIEIALNEVHTRDLA